MAITEALELIRVSTPPSVRIDFKADAKDTATEIDPTAFFQIVMNLCHNAVEAIGDKSGNIKLRLSRIETGEKGALEKLPEGAIGTVRLEICDNGPGISPEIQQRIFEPFFSTKPVGKGTGLGLAIVQNWVGESGGRVTLQSDLGQGSCFTLLFLEYPDTTETAEQPVRPPPDLSISCLWMTRNSCFTLCVGCWRGLAIRSRRFQIRRWPCTLSKATLIVMMRL